jgi:NADH dehydrogenase
MKHVVIIGGGFAGVNLLNHLAGKEEFEVTLVDRNNYHFFPPLLYQLATGFLEVGNISYPYRKLLRKKRNIKFHLGEFEQVMPSENKVVLSTGMLSYDYLVIATGAATNYFGMENVKQFALPMKTVNDALELRNHILQQLEFASITANGADRQKMLNIVVAGGGPTGVEISGMLANMRKDILPKDYPDLSGHGAEAHIYLVDAADAVLKPMSEKSHKDAFDALTKMGVEIRLGMQVKDYADGIVTFADGQIIATNTLIWAAGVGGSVFEGIPPACYGRGKRLITDPFSRVMGLVNIYAIGDTSIQLHESKFPDGHPQMAQVAIQQGKNLSGNLVAVQSGQKQHAFEYDDKGSMAIIGRNEAVVDLPGNKVHFSGFIAFFMWLFVHLVSLVSYRNRVTTLYNWTRAYLTRDQSLRMIIRPFKK